MNHRLKIMRKAMGKTQKEIADYLGIGQNTYSYWERGSVKIDNDGFMKLSDYYGVSIDFLSGKEYKVSLPPNKWGMEKYTEYLKANEYKKVYLEYIYGAAPFGMNAEYAGEEFEDNTITYRRDGKTYVFRLPDDKVSIFDTFLVAVGLIEPKS